MHYRGLDVSRKSAHAYIEDAQGRRGEDAVVPTTPTRMRGGGCGSAAGPGTRRHGAWTCCARPPAPAPSFGHCTSAEPRAQCSAAAPATRRGFVPGITTRRTRNAGSPVWQNLRERASMVAWTPGLFVMPV